MFNARSAGLFGLLVVCALALGVSAQTVQTEYLDSLSSAATTFSSLCKPWANTTGANALSGYVNVTFSWPNNVYYTAFTLFSGSVCSGTPLGTFYLIGNFTTSDATAVTYGYRGLLAGQSIAFDHVEYLDVTWNSGPYSVAVYTANGTALIAKCNNGLSAIPNNVLTDLTAYGCPGLEIPAPAAAPSYYTVVKFSGSELLMGFDNSGLDTLTSAARTNYIDDANPFYNREFSGASISAISSAFLMITLAATYLLV
jgi:hypothetical protein